MSRVGFPLLLIPLAVFNIMVFLMSGVSFDAPVLTVPLLSEAKWTITVSDVLVALGILLLMLEVIRGARGKYLTDFGNTPGHLQHWSRRGFVELVGGHFEIVTVRSPLPWTMLLARRRRA